MDQQHARLNRVDELRGIASRAYRLTRTCVSDKENKYGRKKVGERKKKHFADGTVYRCNQGIGQKWPTQSLNLSDQSKQS